MKSREFCVAITAALALIAFIMVMRFLPELANPQGWAMCGKDNCNVQSWLGALSGWAAGLATFYTILVIKKQHKDNIARLLERDINLAKRIQKNCKEIKEKINKTKILISKLKDIDKFSHEKYSFIPDKLFNYIINLTEEMKKDEFDEFEKIVFIKKNDLKNIRESLKYFSSKLFDSYDEHNDPSLSNTQGYYPDILENKTEIGSYLYKKDVDLLLSVIGNTKEQLDELQDEAETYISKWSIADRTLP